MPTPFDSSASGGLAPFGQAQGGQGKPQDPAGQGLPIPLPPPEFFQSKDWLYDTIMGQIEPDLTTPQIDHLDEKYKGETEEQRKQRMAAYDKAFEIFEEVFKQVSAQVEKDVHDQQVKAHRELLRKEEAEHTQEVSQAEKLLDTDA